MFMGIIVAPIILGVIIISVVSVFIVFRWKRKNILTKKTLIYGLLLSSITFAAITIGYIKSGRIYAFNPYFRIPFLMIYLPALLGIILSRIPNQKTKYIAKVLTVSIVITFFLILIFINFYHPMLEYFGVETYYWHYGAKWAIISNCTFACEIPGTRIFKKSHN